MKKNKMPDTGDFGVIVTRCRKCGYDEFEEKEKLHTPMLVCMHCGNEMIDEFLVYGRIGGGGINNDNSRRSSKESS
jgi:ribosomal protein L40E